MVIKKNFKTKKSSKNFFEQFSNYVHKGQIIFFRGDLGVGKSFYSKVIIKSLTGINIIPSPTFNIVNIYNLNSMVEIWHCDFYRVKTRDEINELGIFENRLNKIILIEWPDLLKECNLDVINFEIFFGKMAYERDIFLRFPKNFTHSFI